MNMTYINTLFTIKKRKPRSRALDVKRLYVVILDMIIVVGNELVE